MVMGGRNKYRNVTAMPFKRARVCLRYTLAVVIYAHPNCVFPVYPVSPVFPVSKPFPRTHGDWGD